MPLFTFLVEDNKTIRDNLIPALEDLASACILGFAERETSVLMARLDVAGLPLHAASSVATA